MRWQLLAAAVITLTGAAAQAEPGIIYQPQNRDAAVTPSQWQGLFGQLAAEGIDELTIQWLQYGQQSFTGRDAWLLGAIEAARGAGLRVRLGLLWDPDYFQRMAPQPDFDYFDDLLARNEALRVSIREQGIGRARFGGWYLPLELSDRFGHNTYARRAITERLTDFASRAQEPVAVSAYVTGHLAPATFARWIEKLRAGGVDVWVQDGYGAALTPERAVPLYLDDMPCSVPIILEHFRRTSSLTEVFTARPATASEREQQSLDVSCHDKHSFSLRYHPAARGILAH